MRAARRTSSPSTISRSADKFANLADAEIADYFDQDEFMARLSAGDFDDGLTAILHEGACSDTMESDGRYMMRNNYRYSVDLLTHCQDNDVPFLYASSAAVYGGSRAFREERACEAPLNVYGYSKFLFDQYVRRVMRERTAQIAGFRYFNVYGPREAHKGRMASVALHFFDEYRADGKRADLRRLGRLSTPASSGAISFRSTTSSAAKLDFLDHPDRSGIFNLGTGRAASFNDVAVATINACRKAEGKAPATLAELVQAGAIVYVPFPPALAGKYQSFTEADLTGLAQRRLQGAVRRCRRPVCRATSNV